MHIYALVKLTSRSWSLPILAALSSGAQGRQATLITATGASRNACAQSLFHLTELGLIERNQGHGHPLRAEYKLTERGKRVGKAAAQMMAISALDNAGSVLQRAWSAPVLATLDEPRYFSEIKRSTASITDRALSQSLTLLRKQNWITREVLTTTMPPRSSYCAIDQGREISKWACEAAYSLAI